MRILNDKCLGSDSGVDNSSAIVDRSKKIIDIVLINEIKLRNIRSSTQTNKDNKNTINEDYESNHLQNKV